MSDAPISAEPGSAVPGHAKLHDVKTSYMFSLLWLALIFAIIAITSNVTELIFVDFVHGNPHRPTSNAIEMMWLFSPIFGIIAMIGGFFVFSLPQLAQALVHARARHFSRSFSYLPVLAAIPAISVLTWYCWEYLTPTDFLGGDEGSDWRPYQHGMTMQRYLSALAFQLPISLYSLVYCEPDLVKSSRRSVVVFGLASAIPIGIWYGHRLAVGQYGFLSG